jgi:hypothetical protein
VAERSIEAVCRDCGRPLSSHGESRPARCEDCFDSFLQARDADFLSSYASLGVTSRRVVAETCLRALVMESPPHRKVLAMTIMEQYVAAASDLIGLYGAIKGRANQAVMRTFLEFKLERSSALAFFQEIARGSDEDILVALGLPHPDEVPRRCPSLSKKDARDLTKALRQMLYDLRWATNTGETAALALAQMAGENGQARALAAQTDWLDNRGLRGDQIATIALDARRRTVNVSAITVDEKKLEGIVTNINAMTRAAQDLIYGVLSMHQEEQRRRDVMRREA